MGASDIRSVRAREILDCRLEPTLRVAVRTADATGVADVPAGRSTGRHEALDRRDGGDRYRGKGVREAVRAVEEVIDPGLSGVDATDQRAVDETLLELDPTASKSELGGNAVVGASLAALKAGAAARDVPLYRHLAPDATTLPVPLFDMIEGGELAATDLDFQEHQLVPAGADSFSAAIRMSAEVYYELGDRLEATHGADSRNVGVEGGYTPSGMDDPRDAFDALLAAAEECGYGEEFVLAVDAAATHFYDEEAEVYRFGGEALTTGELADVYADLADAYPLTSIEDPLQEDDFAGTADLTERLGIQVVGDDLFVTDAERVREGAVAGAANALLLKVNQVGTVTEAREAAAAATERGYAVQVSERSGQTPDTWLADAAVALGTGQVKTGVSRGERTEQYNRLLEIEAELDDPDYGDWPR